MALGSNQDGPCGSPLRTLMAVRPLLEGLLGLWAQSVEEISPGDTAPNGVSSPLTFSWSPLQQTAPVGGPIDQPSYLNAVLLVKGLELCPESATALRLLDALQQLEQSFGRNRSQEERWGPRPLDLDLLFWGDWRLDHPRLTLPHPRLHLRSFVMEPLLAAMQASTPWLS
ncbi:2-amino-4-hydroxy-6-hydroxymethyldihydropteridine pyrophosphokinase [Synechococcus sp. CC9311]|nr:2-amino-4-hydroxy-6-hydroxymethyldihydropteridine pyrophosphokinase [Synechococcus sp. CC9311]